MTRPPGRRGLASPLDVDGSTPATHPPHCALGRRCCPPKDLDRSVVCAPKRPVSLFEPDSHPVVYSLSADGEAQSRLVVDTTRLRLDAIRVLLVGNRSGLREILDHLAAKRADLVIVGTINGEFDLQDVGVAHAVCAAAVKQHNADVLILDGGAYESCDLPPGHTLARSGFDLAQVMLDQLPNVIVVMITALGRRIAVHSVLHVDNIGLDAFVDAIRAAWRSATGPPAK